MPKVLLSSAAMSAMLLYIITNAVMFAFILTSEQIPQTLSDWIVGLGLGKDRLPAVVNVMLLFIGMVMEPFAIVLIMALILYPVAVKLGVDPVHFDHDGGEHGNRAVYAACRAKPLCGFGDIQAGSDRCDQGGDAVDPDGADLPDADHL